MNATQQFKVPCYLIVMSQVLVAQEIAMTIRNLDTGAKVFIATDRGHAVAQLQSVSRLDLAFLSKHPFAYEGSSLSRAIELRGGRAILLGSDAERASPTKDWDVMEQPFDTQALMGHQTSYQPV